MTTADQRVPMSYPGVTQIYLAEPGQVTWLMSIGWEIDDDWIPPPPPLDQPVTRAELPAAVAEAVAAASTVVAAAAAAVADAAAALDVVRRGDPAIPSLAAPDGYALVEVDQAGRASRTVDMAGATWLRLHESVDVSGAQLVPGSVPAAALSGEVPMLEELGSSVAAFAIEDQDHRMAVWVTPEGELDAAKLGPLLTERIGEGGGGSVPSGELPPEVSDFVPSLEELEQSLLIGDVAATRTVILSTCSFDQRLGALSLATAGAVAASSTDYWTVAVQRYRGGVPATLATRTTQASPMTAWTGWTFDLVAWSSTARLLQKEDVLVLVLTKTGAPAALTGLTATWRYEPGVTT